MSPVDSVTVRYGSWSFLRVAAACAVSCSCACQDFDGCTICTSSTLSNWWLRIMPRVSLPAEPASERKHGEGHADFRGSDSSGTISSRTKFVTEYSEVGIRYRSRSSSLKRSSLNLARLVTPSAQA